jgi:drug/metabolite transporter (DMT)-like permease
MRSDETLGFFYGFVGVAAFALTLPATRLAVADLDPLIVALGRCVVAAAPAALLLIAARARRPTRVELRSLALVIAGVIVGFPMLTAIAMRHVPATHGAIVLGVLPLATALAAAVRGGERPSTGFWLAALAGSALVVAYALRQGAGALHLADLALLGAVALGALGYAEGGRLARTMGAWQVICWALVLSLPLLAAPLAWAIAKHGLDASPSAWAGFAYVALVSQFLGFFPWYKGLALGGVARVGQLQLLQPFLTLFASWALLGERLTPEMLVFAAAVLATVAIGRRMPVGRRAR